MKNRLNPFLGTLAVIAMTQAAAHAETYYWDLNQGTANTAVAATGAWDGTNVFWNKDSTGGAGGTTTATVGNADDLYLFSGTSYTTGTITASGSRAASSITFEDNVALTLAGAITIGGTGAKDGIYVASGDNAANAVTGTLTLNGNNTIQNDGTGALTIGATALEPSIDGTGNLELKNNSSGTISLASTTAGAFNFTGSITNSGTGTGGVNIGGSSTGNALIGSNVTSITQNSTTSALTVFGGNSFTGGVNVLAGTANLHNSNVSGGASGSITLGDTSGTAAASIYIGSGTTNATPISVQAGSSGVKTIAGYYATGGTTQKWSGNITANDSVTFWNNNSTGTPSLVFSGSTISIAAGKTITLKNDFTTVSTLSVSGGITGAGAVTLTSGGATLSGTNNYSGGTTISSGTLKFTKLAAMPSTGAVDVATGATLAVNLGGTNEWTTATGGNGTIDGLLAGLGGQSGGTVTYTGAVTLGFDTANASTTQAYSGVIGNVGTTLGLSKLGTGTLELSNANTYTGGTAVSAGLLKINGNQTSATGAVAVSGGALGGIGIVGGAVTVSGTGGINLADGAVENLELKSTLAITGAAGANNLAFDLGAAAAGSDKIAVTGAVTMTTAGAGASPSTNSAAPPPGRMPIRMT